MALKYGNVKTQVDNITFDSKREAKRYQELKYLRSAGYIAELELQPKYVLQESFICEGKREQAITYKADFAYTDMKTGDKVVEDTKGYRTRDFLIKRKLFLKRYPDMKFREM